MPQPGSRYTAVIATLEKEILDREKVIRGLIKNINLANETHLELVRDLEGYRALLSVAVRQVAA